MKHIWNGSDGWNSLLGQVVKGQEYNTDHLSSEVCKRWEESKIILPVKEKKPTTLED